MVISDSEDVPPYLRITAELRRRITSGELRPGERLPSTRQIVREFGIAMATATKVLATLHQEGLARPLPGVGTIVDFSGPHPRSPGAARPRAGGHPTSGLARPRIVRVAVDIADLEGLTALSMRRVAVELGVTTVALHRQVGGRGQLVLSMADMVFAEAPPPDPPPAGWRRCLEAAARSQWAMYRRHPWLAQAMSFTRPLMSPQIKAHAEWVMRALHGLGLDPVAMIHVHTTLAAHIRGLALNLEAEAVQDSGLTDEQWMDAHGTPAITPPAATSAHPLLASVPPRSLDLDSLFEFGLQRLLDGIAILIETSRCPVQPPPQAVSRPMSGDENSPERGASA
ncbi:TetR/AcrR family transcriptional regulator C-terminal domain-containing protein [Parafrankia sp. FMc6]|uniref:TetR/AcrR family transcriptional regulator C-terminal domain-containing protein n=1 Tax=Parafrankia soli TaxID=2599596 RepID=UPI0034D44CD7